MSTVVTPPGGNETPKSGFDGVPARDIELLKGPEEETPVKPPAKEAGETPAPEIKEPEETEIPPEEELEDLDKAPEEETEELPGQISFKDINKEFPELLKKYPALRANYFQAEQFKEIFPTVDDAKVASQKMEVFDFLDPYIAKGDFTPILKIFENAGNTKALENVATSLFPALQAQNKELYVKALNPELKKLFGYVNGIANRNNDDNLKAAVQVMVKAVWGDHIPQDPVQPKEDPEKQQLQQQLTQQQFQFGLSKEMEVKEYTSKLVAKEIEKVLDPTGEFNEFTRNILRDKIFAEVDNSIMQNQQYQREFASLWKQYHMSNHSQEARTRLIRAVLVRAKSLLPAITQRIRFEAVKPKAEIPQQTKTRVTPSAGVPRSRSVAISSKEANSKRMSDMDIIMQGAK